MNYAIRTKTRQQRKQREEELNELSFCSFRPKISEHTNQIMQNKSYSQIVSPNLKNWNTTANTSTISVISDTQNKFT
jgi:hypothetical protein